MRLRTISRIVIGGIIAVSIGLAFLAETIAPRGALPPPKLIGTALSDSRPAPNITLTDQNGTQVSLRKLRGRAVIVAFFYTHCPDTCPMTSQKLRTVLARLGREARRVRALIVTTDPLHDNEQNARTFLARNGMRSWHWLMGTYSQVQRVWKAYHVYAVPPSEVGKLGQTHTAGMYLIDSKGRERVYVDDATAAAAITQDLHIVLNDHKWHGTSLVAPRDGAHAPGFALQSLAGRRLRLAKLSGHPVILNFWATWCVPCKKELPLLERSYRRLRKRLAVLGVDQQEPREAVARFVREARVTYPVLLDRDGNVGYTYHVAGTPTTFFLKRNGMIAHITMGPLTERELTQWTRRLLTE